LGRSLGIDPLISKYCDWSCIYCQLGRTRHRTTARVFHRPVSLVLGELDETLRAAGPHDIDWITIVGSGEPTLVVDLADLIAGIRKRTDTPIALITNGSLLGWPDLREEIAGVDAVLPSLDAGSEELFQRINNPAKGLTLKEHIEGLCALRRTFKGRVWLEIMLLHAVNTGEEALSDLRDAVERIAPDAVHLVVPTRPCAQSWVSAATDEEVARAAEVLGAVAPILPPKSVGEYGNLGFDDPLAHAVELITRHPVCDEEMRTALVSWTGRGADEVLSRLGEDPRVQTIRRGSQVFWVPAMGDYVGERSER
jgi:wyosine [tRNA(Phe)-imidazoG37] synthetase (radical SAM superfamily)